MTERPPLNETVERGRIAFIMEAAKIERDVGLHDLTEDEQRGLIAAVIGSALANPPKHDFWGAGERDCPREIRAGNGELHTLRCKVCGEDNPRDEICRAHVQP